jgi:hypothetical protein
MLVRQSVVRAIFIVHERFQTLDDIVLSVEHGVGACIVLAAMVVDTSQHCRERDLALGFNKILDPSAIALAAPSKHDAPSLHSPNRLCTQ